MNIPSRILMKPTLFADGARGMAIQTTRNDEFGVTCEAMRKDRASPFVERWFADSIQGKDFATWRELRAAMMESTP